MTPAVLQAMLDVEDDARSSAVKGGGQVAVSQSPAADLMALAGIPM